MFLPKNIDSYSDFFSKNKFLVSGIEMIKIDHFLIILAHFRKKREFSGPALHFFIFVAIFGVVADFLQLDKISSKRAHPKRFRPYFQKFLDRNQFYMYTLRCPKICMYKNIHQGYST